MAISVRHLVLVLGDQLNQDASALQDFDPQQDAVWMAEVDEESTHVTSAKQRTTVFLSAMRHFAADLRVKNWQVLYSLIDAEDNVGTLAGELDKAIALTQPKKLIMTAPGDWRVLQSLRSTAKRHALALEIRDDPYFFSTVREFSQRVACSAPSCQALTMGAQPLACTATMRGNFCPTKPMACSSAKAFHMPIRPVPPPVG